jgi:hypothetical protein
MRPITEMILLVLLTLAMLTETASAQQRTFYDAGGKVVWASGGFLWVMVCVAVALAVLSSRQASGCAPVSLLRSSIVTHGSVDNRLGIE